MKTYTNINLDLEEEGDLCLALSTLLKLYCFNLFEKNKKIKKKKKINNNNNTNNNNNNTDNNYINI